MYKAMGLLLLTFVPLAAVMGQEFSPVHTSTLTVGGGGAVPPHDDSDLSSGPSFSANYEYRLFKYLSLEGGVTEALPTIPSYEPVPVYLSPNPPAPGLPVVTATAYVRTNVRSITTLAPYGVRGILPLFDGRAELFVTFGGAEIWSYEGGGNLLQYGGGFRIALDKKRHFWAGGMARYYNDFGSDRRRWVPWDANIGFRFGHR